MATEVVSSQEGLLAPTPEADGEPRFKKLIRQAVQKAAGTPPEFYRGSHQGH